MQHSKANIINRIDAIDSLRGFALLAITFRHFLTRYNYETFVYSSNTTIAKVDKLVEFVDFNLFYGKGYAIFALLFGFSFFLQQKSKGVHFQQYMVARLLVLLLLACINSIFFPGGDILGLYAIVGFLILPLIKVSPKWLLLISIFFLLQPLEWIDIIVACFNGSHGVIQVASAPYHQQLNNIASAGSLSQIAWANITKGQLSGLIWSLESGRFTQTVGLMLLGFSLGKSGWLVRLVSEGRNALSYAYVPLFISILCFGVDHLMIGDSFEEKKIEVILSNWINFCVASLYILVFISIYDKFVTKHMPALKTYGRMSLTNYITQSITGGLLFAPFGFYLASKLSSTYLAIVFLIFVSFQIFFSRLWLGRYRYGPFESFWRRSSFIISGLKSNRNY